MENTSLEKESLGGGDNIKKLDDVIKIKDIAENELSLTLDEEELEAIKDKINTIISYLESADKLVGKTPEEIIRGHLKKIKDETVFTDKYNSAKNLYSQCWPVGEFYTFNPTNPLKLRNYIKKNHERADDFFPLVAHKFQRIIDTFGAPLVDGTKAYFVDNALTNDPTIEEVEITTVQRDGDLRIAGRKGSFTPYKFLSNTEEAEQYIKEVKDGKYNKAK